MSPHKIPATVEWSLTRYICIFPLAIVILFTALATHSDCLEL